MIGWLMAAQLAVVARAPDTAGACLPIEIVVAARAPGATAPRIAFPATTTLQLLRSSAVSRLERDGAGRPSSITEATFVVATPVTGHVAIPPFVATTDIGSGRSAPLVVDVRDSDERTPRVLVRATLDPRRDQTDLSVLVGQQVDYVVDVQLNEAARQRLRRNPTFFPPEMPSVLAYDLPAAAPVVRRGARCFETLSYRRALFPLFAGAGVIPPAVLTYALPVSTSFFSREETVEVRTETVRFNAVEPPAVGRPDDFAGAVGSLRASASVASDNARMGDPIVLTVRVEGRGNVKLLPRPALSVDWAAIAPGAERVTIDSTAARVRGAKEFDWLLTPRRAGRLVVDQIRYPYFDPDRSAYEVAVTDSLSVQVVAAALAAADTGVGTRGSVRATLRPEIAPPLTTRQWYWLVLMAAPLPATLRRVLSRRRRRRRNVSPLRRLRRMASADHAPAPRDLRRAFLDALRERVPGAATTATSAGLGRALRRAGVTDAAAARAESVLEQLDAAAFSPAGVARADLVMRATDVASVVDAEAVRAGARVGVGRAATVLLAGAFLTAVGVHAATPPVVQRIFADGVRAFERGEYAAAQRLFARTTDRLPRSVDAWADFASSALARGDSAHAALGWQRALRLDPLDAEAREQLATLQPPLLGSPAYVAPVAIDHVAVVALALWLGAWAVLAFPPGRRPPHARALAGAAVVLAVASLLAALQLQEQHALRGLGAVRSARTLVDAPSTSGGAVAAVTAGEIGRLGAREGDWVRITIDGARAGWLPVAAILALDAPAGAD